MLWVHALLAAPLLALMLAKPLVLLSLVAKFLLLNQVGKRLLFTAPPQPQNAGTGPRSCPDPPAVPLPTEGVNKPVQAPSPSCSHVESQQDDAMLLAPPSSSPFASCPVLLSNLAPLVCSAPELYVGGHAAAFTNPPDSFSRSGGVSDHAIPDVTHADSLRTIDASNASASTHTGHDSHDAQKMFMRQERRRGSLLLLVPLFSTAAPLFVNFLSPSYMRTLVHEHEKLA